MPSAPAAVAIAGFFVCLFVCLFDFVFILVVWFLCIEPQVRAHVGLRVGLSVSFRFVSCRFVSFPFCFAG